MLNKLLVMILAVSLAVQTTSAARADCGERVLADAQVLGQRLNEIEESEWIDGPEWAMREEIREDFDALTVRWAACQ